MPSSQHRRRTSPATSPPPGTASLRVPSPPERLTALLHTHHRLLDKIKQKRRELERLAERLQTTMAAAAGRLQPVIAEIAQFDRELHTLFAELLGRKKQSRSILAVLKDVYRTLQQSGIMSPQQSAARDPSAEEEPRPGARAAEETEPPPPKDSGGVTARRPGEGAANQSLRALFRRLAEALHPDKVQQEDEKLRRTEAMKDITRAYQDGDLARLLELERSWLTGSALAPNNELDRRCAVLQETNAALRVQLDEITGELKDLRRSAYATLLHDLSRTAKLSGKEPIDAMIDGAKEDRERLRELVDFVGAFRDGKIDIKEFARGPGFTRQPKTDEPDEVDVFLDELFEQTADPQPRRGKKRRRAAHSDHP